MSLTFFLLTMYGHEKQNVTHRLYSAIGATNVSKINIILKTKLYYCFFELKKSYFVEIKNYKFKSISIRIITLMTKT